MSCPPETPAPLTPSPLSALWGQRAGGDFCHRFQLLRSPKVMVPNKEPLQGAGERAEGSRGWKRLLLRGGPRVPAPPSTWPPLSAACELPSTALAPGTDGAATAEGAQGRRNENETRSPPLCRGGCCEPVGNIWCPCGIWQQSLLLWHFLW